MLPTGWIRLTGEANSEFYYVRADEVYCVEQGKSPGGKLTYTIVFVGAGRIGLYVKETLQQIFDLITDAL